LDLPEVSWDRREAHRIPRMFRIEYLQGWKEISFVASFHEGSHLAHLLSRDFVPIFQPLDSQLSSNVFQSLLLVLEIVPVTSECQAESRAVPDVLWIDGLQGRQEIPSVVSLHEGSHLAHFISRDSVPIFQALDS